MSVFGKFNSPSKGRLTLTEVVDDILEYMKSDGGRDHRLMIGTDSSGRGRVIFITAIIVHKVGKGGKFYWKRTYKKNLFSLRPIIYEEVALSLSIAEKVMKEFEKRVEENPSLPEFEIHIDVGEDGETKSMIKEVVGMVIGSGFNAKTKPASYAASKVADRYT